MTTRLKELLKIAEEFRDSDSPDAQGVTTRIMVTPLLASTIFTSRDVFWDISNHISDYLAAKRIKNFVYPPKSLGAGPALDWLIQFFEAHREQIFAILKFMPMTFKSIKRAYRSYKAMRAGWTERSMNGEKPVVWVWLNPILAEQYANPAFDNCSRAVRHLLLVLPDLAEELNLAFPNFRLQYSLSATLDGHDPFISVTFGNILPTKKLCARLIRHIHREHLHNGESVRFDITKRFGFSRIRQAIGNPR